MKSSLNDMPCVAQRTKQWDTDIACETQTSSCCWFSTPLQLLCYKDKPGVTEHIMSSASFTSFGALLHLSNIPPKKTAMGNKVCWILWGQCFPSAMKAFSPEEDTQSPFLRSAGALCLTAAGIQTQLKSVLKCHWSFVVFPRSCMLGLFMFNWLFKLSCYKLLQFQCFN